MTVAVLPIRIDGKVIDPTTSKNDHGPKKIYVHETHRVRVDLAYRYHVKTATILIEGLVRSRDYYALPHTRAGFINRDFLCNPKKNNELIVDLIRTSGMKSKIIDSGGILENRCCFLGNVRWYIYRSAVYKYENSRLFRRLLDQELKTAGMVLSSIRHILICAEMDHKWFSRASLPPYREQELVEDSLSRAYINHRLTNQRFQVVLQLVAVL